MLADLDGVRRRHPPPRPLLLLRPFAHLLGDVHDENSSKAPAFQPRRVQSLFPGLKLELADVDAGTAHAGFFHGLTRGGFLGGLVRLPATC